MYFNIILAQISGPDSTQVTDTAQKVQETAVQANNIGIGSVFSHVTQDPVLLITLLILIGFSVASWAIIFFKLSQLKSAQSASLGFWQKFSSSPSIGDALAERGSRKGPVFEVFVTGQRLLDKIRKASDKYTDYHRSYVAQKIQQTREEELYKLEQYVPFLATTASATPFIGLFGTVWGILMAFMKIGQDGSTSLATVGPHISEALVATAVGLFAAIPAVIFYNFFVGKIKIIRKMMDLFIGDFLIKSEREMVS